MTARAGHLLVADMRAASPATLLVELLIAIVVAAMVAVFATVAELNLVTVALTFHVGVVAMAAWRGPMAGTLAALAAAAGLSHLLHPVGSWRIADPANWIAFFSFLIASTITSRVVVKARQAARNADERNEELALLYQTGVHLLSIDDADQMSDAAARALEQVGGGGGLFVRDGSGGALRRLIWMGDEDETLAPLITAVLDDGVVRERDDGDRRDVIAPLGGRRPFGIFVVRAAVARTQAIESVAALLTLSIEHQRLLRESAHIDALRRSDELKTNLLRAVSHDLNTPLTSIGIDVAAIRRIAHGDPQLATVVERLERDANRLRRRTGNLLALAQLEAGALVPRRDPTPPADLFRSVEEHLSLISRERQLVISVANDCPDLDVDPSLALEIVVNLIENAHRASPPGEPIELIAARAGEGAVEVEVRDRGSGFSGGSADGGVELTDLPRRGLGLQIALNFTAALGGTLSLHSREGGGAIARIVLPAARESGEESGA